MSAAHHHVGWPFWLGCLLAPLLAAWVLPPWQGEQPLQLFLFSILSLVSAGVVGLFVQALWSALLALRRGELRLLEVFFFTLILLFAVGFGVLLYRVPHLPDVVRIAGVCAFPLIIAQVYARFRPVQPEVSDQDRDA